MAHPLAGQKPPAESLVNVPRLMAAYYTAEVQPKVSFGTSGHRGSALKGTFNELHVAAITQAAVEHRARQGYTGPMFLGFDTHGLSEAAFRTALEVLAANGVETRVHQGDEYTPTPVMSFHIIEHNKKNPRALADGLIITPSHNPPVDGGIKYNPPHGGPADVDVTGWVEKRATELMGQPGQIKRVPYYKAKAAATTKEVDFIRPFVKALGDVVDMAAIKGAGLKLAADPLGGSGVHFWGPIAEEWGLDITVVNKAVDASFSFMTLDSDGAIRMDCSSPYAMAGLIAMGGRYDLAFGNDPDYDRHGIVSGGQLMNPNHYLAVAIDYLTGHRPHWPAGAKVGKTLVSSSIIDKVVAASGREVLEVPVGFKWFVDGLSHGTIVFGGEESAGASYLRRDGTTWTTDKDGFCMVLLGAEIMARTGQAPHEHYAALAAKFGDSLYKRLDTGVTDAQKAALKAIDAHKFMGAACAGHKVRAAFTEAPGNHAPIGGLKVVLDDNSWFAMRPSGTEPKLKLYTESFSGEGTLAALAEEAPRLVFGA